jgi:phosphatidylglycerophosphate synthase
MASRARSRMKLLPDWLKNGYLRVIDPVANWLIRRQVHPNTITIVGTVCTVAGGVIYGTGHISIGGWFLGLTALTDVLDGTVARRTGRTSVFGAFLDSTLDRLADGAVLGGLAVFYALSPVHRSVPMVVVCLLGLIGSFLTSYTRARAEALGLDAKVGVLQRPERVVLLSAPQAFFGLALHGWVLAIIIIVLAVTAWITVVQRMVFVYKATTPRADDPLRLETDASEEPRPTWLRRRRAARGLS